MKLSIEMILYQKKKKKKIFQVKTLSKDVRKTTVQSFMFLSNSFEVCRPLCKQNKNMLFSPLNQWNKKSKHTWISRKIFVFYRKWKIKNTIVLDVRSAAHLEAFWIKKGVLFLHVSNVLGVCRGVRLWLHALYAEVCLCSAFFAFGSWTIWVHILKD